MKFDSALSIVVLPEPVPPEMIVETLPATAAARTSAIAGRKRPDFDEPVHIEDALGEFSNRNQRSVDGDRPDRDVDARAVAQPRVDHGRRFVDATSDRRDDPVDDAQEVRFVLEMDLGLLQLPEALDEAALVGVDENVGDGRVLQQRLDRTIARHLGDDLIRENVELFLIERQAFAANVVADISSNLLCKFVGGIFSSAVRLNSSMMRSCSLSFSSSSPGRRAIRSA